MKFTQRFSIPKKMDLDKFVSGIWNPSLDEWRFVIEDYLHISRKRIENKLSLFKLQLNILQDIVSNYQGIDNYKNEKVILENKKEERIISDVDFQKEEKMLESEISALEIINRSVKEIADGIAWRFFNYNRAILYTLANKQPISPIKYDKGLLKTVLEYSEMFLMPDKLAILNDITNFLRVGDITTIDTADGTIEFVEVKSSRQRGHRITRQKERMEELVEFFNTGISEFDGNKLKIVDSAIKQKNYLNILKDGINRAKAKGIHSEAIGNYLIIEIINFETIFQKKIEIEEANQYFKSKHKTITNKWVEMEDIVIPFDFIDKLNFARNYAPYSIFPFNEEICVDIIMGRTNIRSIVNFSEIVRIMDKYGWKTVDNLFLKIKALEENDEKGTQELKEQSVEHWLTVEKEGFRVDLPPGILGRLHFELLSPMAIVDHLNELYEEGPRKENEMFLTNYINNQKIWD